jgi:hypothetical protein
VPPTTASAPPTQDTRRPDRRLAEATGEGAESLVVVHVVTTPGALRNRSFDKLLASNGIAIDLDANNETKSKDQFRSSEPQTQSASATEQKSALDESNQSGVEDVQLVLVDAPAETVASCLKELKSDERDYLGVNIDEGDATSRKPAAREIPQDKSLPDLSSFNRGTVPDAQRNRFRSYFTEDRAAIDGIAKNSRSAGVVGGALAAPEKVQHQETESLSRAPAGRARRLLADEWSTARADRTTRLTMDVAAGDSPQQGKPGASSAASPDSPLRRSETLAASSPASRNQTLRVLFVLTADESPASGAPPQKAAE